MRHQESGKFFTSVMCAAALIGFSAVVHAQTGPSAGCQNINLDSRDGQNGGGGTPDLEFFAGEIIQLSAGEPTSFGGANSIELRVGGSVVDTDSFPGSLSYEFGANTTTFVQWDVSPDDNVTWSVNCVGGAAPTPTPTPGPIRSSQAIPTLPIYGMALTIIGVAVLAMRSLRSSDKRKSNRR